MYAFFPPDARRLDALHRKARALPLSTPADPLATAAARHWHVDRYAITVATPPAATAAAVHRAAADVIGTVAFFPRWMLTDRRGDTVVVGARMFGVLGIFQSRVTREWDEGDDRAASFDLGFAYATLRGHFETGVETFRARRAGGKAPVEFTIEAVSRAVGPIKLALSWLAVRRLQRRFGRDAAARFASELDRRLGTPGTPGAAPPPVRSGVD